VAKLRERDTIWWEGLGNNVIDGGRLGQNWGALGVEPTKRSQINRNDMKTGIQRLVRVGLGVVDSRGSRQDRG